MREATGWAQDVLPSSRATGSPTYHRNALRGGAPIEDGESMIDTEATVKVWVGDERLRRHRRGQRPGQRPRRRAAARRSTARYPALERIHLTDYKVRVLDGDADTGAVVRVLIDSTDGDRTLDDDRASTTNIIEASWQALVDSLVYGLLHAGPGVRPGASAVGHGVASERGRPRVRPRQADGRSARVLRVAASAPRVVAGRAARATLDEGQPAATRLGVPGPRPGLRAQAGPPVPGRAPARPRASTTRTRMAGCRRRRAQAGVALRPGAGASTT